MNDKTDIRAMTLEEIENWCKSQTLPLFRAGQIYDWLWKKYAPSFDEMTSLPVELRKIFKEEYAFTPLARKEKQISHDGTVKVSFQLHDGYLIEGVLIPAEERTTACISTQAGCALSCNFCATGQMGFSRNLTAGEIFDQYTELNKESIEKYNHLLSNIVYMGMGEPLLNYHQTLMSVDHLIDNKHGPGISPQRITVSTAGISTGIRNLGDDHVKFQLAVSLHTANQKKRMEIMPVAKKYPLEELTAAMKYYHEKTNERITIEYLLLNDLNDSIKDAHELAVFCKKFPVKINIIEYNEVSGLAYKKSTEEKTKLFKAYLEDRNLLVNVRQSRGNDIHAACGQLAAQSKSINQTNDKYE